MTFQTVMQHSSRVYGFGSALLWFCACTFIAWSPSSAALPVQSSSQSMQANVTILTATEGADFKHYKARLQAAVKRNWYSIMPESALLGQKGSVSVVFHIQQDGSLLAEDPIIETMSGSKALDNAAFDAIRNSAPFERLPAEFHAPNIKLRVVFLYNLPDDLRKVTPHQSPSQSVALRCTRRAEVTARTSF